MLGSQAKPVTQHEQTGHGFTLWLCQNSYGKSPFLLWENPLFLWSFSIAMLVYQRVTSWASYDLPSFEVRTQQVSKL